jgi:HlyD family secretion protein
MSPQDGIFRAAALERLSSPERLDRLVTLTSPRSWLALIALCLLIGAAVAWSFLGTVPTRISGRGILVALGGSVFDAMAPAAGTVANISVAPGALVKKGDLIAELTQPSAQQSLDHARATLADLKAEQARLTTEFAAEEAAQKANLERQRTALRGIIDSSKQRAAYYDQTVSQLGDLSRAGFVTKQRMQDLVQSRQQAEQDARRAESDIAKLDADAAQQSDRRTSEANAAQSRVNEAERRVGEFEVQLATTTAITAPVAGRVTEIKVSDGAVARPGMPIASIQSGEEGLELVLYVPPEHGKRVQPGMTVRIEPATVRKEEWGTLLGEVVSISEFPATADGMLAILQNAELVRDFTLGGPPYTARVRLLKAEGKAGRYRWSSGDGPELAVTAGTLAQAGITVREDRPIALVIPLFKRLAGVAQ